jgi:hypothetical protein
MIVHVVAIQFLMVKQVKLSDAVAGHEGDRGADVGRALALPGLDTVDAWFVVAAGSSISHRKV